MSHVHEILKEPLQDLFRKYAFLDLEVIPGTPKDCSPDSLCVEVACDGSGGGGIVVMASPELADLAAANILGSTDVRPSQRMDVVCEMANILAGHVYEIVRAGQRPRAIGIPQTLAPERACERWRAAAEEARLTLRDEAGIVGGVLISLPQTWAAWT